MNAKKAREIVALSGPELDKQQLHQVLNAIEYNAHAGAYSCTNPTFKLRPEVRKSLLDMGYSISEYDNYISWELHE